MVRRLQRAVVVAIMTVIAGGAGDVAGQVTAQPLGFIRDGRDAHLKTGIQFLVPPEWRVMGTGPSSDGGDMVQLREAAHGI